MGIGRGLLLVKLSLRAFGITTHQYFELGKYINGRLHALGA